MFYVEGNFYFKTDPCYVSIRPNSANYMGCFINVAMNNYNYTQDHEFLRINLSLTIEESTPYNHLQYNNPQGIEQFVNNFLTLYFYEVCNFKFLRSENFSVSMRSNDPAYYNPNIDYNPIDHTIREFGLFDIKDTPTIEIVPNVKNEEITQKVNKKRKIIVIEDDV